MPKKKILQISHNYTQPFAQLCVQYARLFDNREYQVTTVFLRGRADASVMPEDCGEVVFLDLPAKALKGLKIGALNKIKQIIGGQVYEGVIAHRFKSIYLASLLTLTRQLPWVFAVAHEMDVFARRSRRWLVFAVQQKIYLVGVTQAVTEDLKKSCPSQPDSHLLSLHNCLDVSELRQRHKHRDQARSELDLAVDDFLFVSVARLIPKKSHDHLIQAFAQAKLPKQAKLVLIGDGRLQAQLQQLALELGLNERVIFLGNVPDAAHYMKAFDVLVGASNLEAFGMVLIEAMAAQVPVVATAIPAFSEVVGDAGLLVTANDVSALAGGLHKSYQWTDFQKQQITQAATLRLQDKFSSEAFKQNFWRLPLAWSKSS